MTGMLLQHSAQWQKMFEMIDRLRYSYHYLGSIQLEGWGQHITAEIVNKVMSYDKNASSTV